ncbi:glycosyltransferase [Onishia taeanensis]
MKIIAILPTYRSTNYAGGVGGGEISNRILLEGLVSHGHDVSVVTIKGAGVFEENINGVVVYEVGEFTSFCFPNYVFRYFLLRRLANKVAERFQPDIVLAATESSAIAVEVARKIKKPSGVFVRAFENFSSSNGFEFDLVVFLKSAVKKFLAGDYGVEALKAADFLIPNSDFMSLYCDASVKGGKSFVVYPPLEVSMTKPIEIPCKIKKVVMVGTSEKKGIGLFRDVAENFPEIEFRVLGSPDVNLGEEFSEKNVTFVGWCDVFKEFEENADLVLVPSLWEEPFGRVAIEALAAGKVVLVSDIGGLTEAVSAQELLLVKPGCISSWTNRVQELIDHPKIFLEASDKARLSAQKYSKLNQVKRLEKLLKSYAI